MTKFYTKTGDDGYTGLLGDARATKYDLRIEAIGTVDEANASLGLARSVSNAAQTDPILITVQRDLYHIMTELAVLPENSSKFSKLSGERVAWIEAQIDELSKTIAIPNEFIVPGDSHAGASIDLARTIIRRAERHIAQLLHQGMIDNPELLHYINRLSSLCFVIELIENQAGGHPQPTLAKE